MIRITSNVNYARQRAVSIDPVQRCIELVAKETGVHEQMLIGERRIRSVVRARWLAICLVYNATGLSMKKIGFRFGLRDHTTIMHALREFEKLMSDDDILRAQTEGLVARMRAEQGWTTRPMVRRGGMGTEIAIGHTGAQAA